MANRIYEHNFQTDQKKNIDAIFSGARDASKIKLVWLIRGRLVQRSKTVSFKPLRKTRAF